MDILLYYDFIERFLENKTQLGDNETNVLIWNTFNNKNNVFLYSDKYFDFTIEYLDSKSKLEYVNELYPIINNLFDNGRIKPISNCNGENMDDEFIQLHENHQENILFTFIINYKATFLNIIDRLTIIDQSNPINKDWIYLNLAANEKVIIKPDNFTTLLEIQDFFRNIYEIPKIIRDVNIFNDYYNFTPDDCFKYLSENGVQVCYYSKGKIKDSGVWRLYTSSELSDIKTKLQSKFPNRFKYFTTTNFAITHKRRIAFENIIVYADIDFPQVKISNNNWIITLEFSEIEYGKLMQTLEDYTLR